MKSYKLTEMAGQDIQNLANYTKKEWGEEQADKYTREVFNALDKIAEIPEIGLIANYAVSNFRKMPIGKHLIFYTIFKKQVVIVRILHHSRDIQKVDFNI
jgi:toxin ParE1/3/4